MKSKRSINICRMISGDRDLIAKSLFSENKYVRMDAILWATYHHMSTPDIIDRIKDLKKDDSLFLGYTISNFAIAALDNLGIEKYHGKDDYQKELIKSFIPTKDQVEEILKANYDSTAP